MFEDPFNLQATKLFLHLAYFVIRKPQGRNMLSYIFPTSQNSTFSIYKFHTMPSKSVLVKLSPYFVVRLNKQVLYF